MGARILVADDDQEILDLLKFTFESEHYRVITASDGEKAAELAVKEQPDLVILDVNMPKLSGYEVCEKIRQDSSTCLIPIIMLTSLSKAKDMITGIKLGADEYLNKPFDTFELVTRVEGLLKRTKATLSANPLTGLPGNVTIEEEIRRRMEQKEIFAFSYFDVDNFKAFNDKYGFEKGDNVIRLIAVILRTAMGEIGNKNDFLGNLGGDDFVLITSQDKIKAIAERIIQNFDALMPHQYDEDVRSRGYLWAKNRQGQDTKFSIMTLSIGGTVIRPGMYQHYSQVVDQAKNLLRKAKEKQSSNFVFE
jgi:diguanylate cyclase (GGDEF)-like protein